MRRGKSTPEPSARGNFTPPPRAAAPSNISAAPGPGPAPAGRSGGRLSPRNWRVPARLNAILLLPVLVGLVMGGFQVKGSVDTWHEAEDAEATARLVRASLTYANRLIDERDVTAAPLLRGRTDDPVIAQSRGATDTAAAEFDVAARNMPDDAGLKRRLAAFRTVEGDLTELRSAAYTGKLSGVRTEEGYVEVQHPLMEFANELGLGTGNITSYGRTVYAISLGKAAVSLQRSVGMHLLVAPGPDATSLDRQKLAVSSYAYLEGIALDEYAGGGTPEDMARLEQVTEKVKSDTKALVEKAEDGADARGKEYVPPPSTTEMVAKMAALTGTGRGARAALTEDGVTADSWWAVNTLKFDGYRTIEAELADKAVNEAAGIADGARQDTFLTSAAVVVALLTAFLLAGLMARQMSHSMSRLRNAAFGIAEQRLPMLVDQLSRAEPGRVDTRVEPIPIHTTDEIGEVARAFDQVHREAVRLASEQALLRGNINAIFTNLSRRNQSLIEGQLTLITELENSEADPDQLESLFRLDHLATRMRRNGENLLVLAGEEPGSRWDQPVPLIDVLRASSSEVEQYERIELSGVPEADIHGRAVTDLVHLLSELLENATTFSSPQTRVKVTATRLPDARIMIEIHDKGIGLTTEDFADINHKLANPPTVDAAVSQRMGLFVVGRLADRHGIRVQLRPSGEQAGTTSLVMLPDAITHGAGAEPSGDVPPVEGAGSTPLAQMISGQPGRGAGPLRTAAELGFDDSRYPQAADGVREPDPAEAPLRSPEHAVSPEGGPESGAHPGGPGHDGSVPQPTAYDPHQPYQDAPVGYPPQPVNGYPQQHSDAYGQVSGTSYEDPFFRSSDGYQEQSHPEADRQDPDGIAPEPFGGYEARPHQPGWQHGHGYPEGLQQDPAGYPESVRPADAGAAERVGFDRPEPTAVAGHPLTGAGLPRRGSPSSDDGAPGTGRQWLSDAGRDLDGPRRSTSDERPGDDGSGNGGDWRSANDDRWQRAEQLRRPKADGVTASGLPRRVPRANLVEGTAEQTPQGGPQVSRAPEDVRGRLSNLRRGVQRGRQAGSEKNGQATGDDHSGSGSTYNQER
ncbi:nitrate- and nitrite sensing domain-containing protein [Streptomyces sp. NPDC005955]|uniref:sensor histidine kinase n=1 Tax=Streptomyces sp. NPDC005955 TaxID=3364738 RepID=UPI00368F5CD6